MGRALFIGAVRRSCWSVKAAKPTLARPRRSLSAAAKCGCASIQHGYARIVRPMRSSQAIDPVSNVVDGAADMEREAALTVCTHLNEHVESLAFPHRWTPSPDQVLLPVAARAFTEPQPKPPKASISSDPRVKAAADPQAFNDYLDARAAWLARRFAWDAEQQSIHQLKDKAGSGDLDGMREYLMKVLHDVAVAVADYDQLRVQRQGRSQTRIHRPGSRCRYPTAKPRWRAATGSRSAACQTSRTPKLHNQHARRARRASIGRTVCGTANDRYRDGIRAAVAGQRQTAALHHVRREPIASDGRRCIRTAQSPQTRRFAAWVSWSALQSDRARRVHGGRAIRLIALRAIVPMPMFSQVGLSPAATSLASDKKQSGGKAAFASEGRSHAL